MSAPQYDLARIKTANRVRGLYFFSRDTLRFFRSRISARVHQGPGGIYLVTSEQFDDHSPRLYTVRLFDPVTAGIETVGQFQEHPIAYQAHAEAARLASQVNPSASC